MIAYRLRVSARARRVSLHVTLRGQVEVVVPRRYDRRKIPAILEREQAWIREALSRVEQRRQAFVPPVWQVPVQIDLTAVGVTWRVCGRATEALEVRAADAGPRQLQLTGRIADGPVCRRALLRWLVRQGRTHLLPRLRELGRALDFPCTRVAVRLQRTRWASCSTGGTISLNARLLLLPSHLVDYVMVHELCHTREMNHSPRFWRLLARHCPEYRERRVELRAAGKRLPDWASDSLWEPLDSGGPPPA